MRTRFSTALLTITMPLIWVEGHTTDSNHVRAFIDDEQPGWRAMGSEDFTEVNSADNTWSWKEGILHCTGQPVSVLRTSKEYTNFEMVIEWSHQKPGGNSGVFIWASPESIKRIMNADNPGPPLPDGIEIQMLDHAYKEQAKARGEPTDWFSTHGDVFPVRANMTPFPPLSSVSDQRIMRKQTSNEVPMPVTRKSSGRSFPRKHLSKGHGEWNHYYIRAINGEVRLWVNGEEVSGGTDCDPSKGYICLESEGSPIIFRKLRIRGLP
ncbi:MAG: DUF1080 domain-containing protein [Verrucomicrobia bacterium]|nr:DUF1080 domain-containing protein [Verrucomicrobiota bacterium]